MVTIFSECCVSLIFSFALVYCQYVNKWTPSQNSDPSSSSLQLQRDIIAQGTIRGRSRASIPWGPHAEMWEICHSVILWGISADRGTRLWFEGSIRTTSAQPIANVPSKKSKTCKRKFKQGKFGTEGGNWSASEKSENEPDHKGTTFYYNSQFPTHYADDSWDTKSVTKRKMFGEDNIRRMCLNPT
jgi:hypothetical protein